MIDPDKIMAEHEGHWQNGAGCSPSPAHFLTPAPCLTYRLAEALTTAHREGAEKALRDVIRDWPYDGQPGPAWLEMRADKIAKGEK